MASRSHFSNSASASNSSSVVSVGHKYGTVIMTLPSPGVKRSTSHWPTTQYLYPRQTSVCELPEHDDLPPTHAQKLVSIYM